MIIIMIYNKCIIILINKAQVRPNHQQCPRARPYEINFLFLLRGFIGLIQMVGPIPTRSRLTVIWTLTEEAGLWCGATPLLIINFSWLVQTQSHQYQTGQ